MQWQNPGEDVGSVSDQEDDVGSVAGSGAGEDMEVEPYHRIWRDEEGLDEGGARDPGPARLWTIEALDQRL